MIGVDARSAPTASLDDRVITAVEVAMRVTLLPVNDRILNEASSKWMMLKRKTILKWMMISGNR